MTLPVFNNSRALQFLVAGAALVRRWRVRGGSQRARARRAGAPEEGAVTWW